VKRWITNLVKRFESRVESVGVDYRLLSERDIGKVFVAKDLTPHPNFGAYKVLISVNTPGLYAFNTFDLVEGSPQGRFLVSHPAKPIYREVSIAPDILAKAEIEMKKANARLGEQIRAAMQEKRVEN